MKVSDILCDESKWTKGALAKDKNGNKVDIHCPDAVCYCIMGAFGKAREFKNSIHKVWDSIYNIYGNKYKDIPDFNDSSDTTFEDIKKVLERAGL